MILSFCRPWPGVGDQRATTAEHTSGRGAPVLPRGRDPPGPRDTVTSPRQGEPPVRPQIHRGGLVVAAVAMLASASSVAARPIGSNPSPGAALRTNPVVAWNRTTLAILRT